MELKLQTPIGELVAIFETYPINCYQDVCVGKFKNIPILVESNNVNEAIKELCFLLDCLLRYERDLGIKISCLRKIPLDD